METNYDIEFDITSILNQILYGTTNTNRNTNREYETSTMDVSGSNQPTDSHISDVSGTWISMMQTSQSIIDNLIYSYNNQMQRYNQNMERYNNNVEHIIQLLESLQTQIHHHITPQNRSTSATTNGRFTTHSINSQRRNAVRNEGNLIRLLLNTSNYGANRNTVNMLYTYLYPNLQNRGLNNELATQVQRANAIQTITYISGMTSATCPISLLSFQEGEQVSQIKYCMHIFKTEYLNNWLTNYSSCCPVCRYDIRSYINNNSNNNDNNDTDNNDTDNSETDENEFQ